MIMTNDQMIAAINYIISKGSAFSDQVSLAMDYQAEYGPTISVPRLLQCSNAPDFGCSVIDTWNGGVGERISKFTSGGSGIDAFNDCVEWIHKHTPFSFNEATKHQGLEIEYFVIEGDTSDNNDLKTYRVTLTIEVSASNKQDAADEVAAWLSEGGEYTWGVTELGNPTDEEDLINNA